ncbi:hypothetical protein AVEN_135557-1 [Araneus ventricosus]|uniref:MADF domain-containing protein n=1 Tax=Araneus ventricosus TaxID=182803 RepID=A0A4Y2UFC4_ARAVE|nr:hypothetical protein AVEN_33378-1 [Araneus ventricosus]GBO10296.1 hypothetical protein AVEN_135557-1 [Araneus ventricosus]
MEWTREQVLTLIELFRQRPDLWDETRAEFKDKNKKNIAWNEIAEEMKVNKAEAQAKFRNITSQFYREVKKAKRDPGADSKIKWFAYEHLQFLKHKKTPRYHRESRAIKETEDLENGAEVEVLTVNENTSTTVTTPTPPTPSRCSKRAGKRRFNPMIEEVYSVTGKSGKIVETRDEFDLFGGYIACQLRKCTDLHDMAVAKHRINQILFDLELSNLNRESNENLSFRSWDSRTSANIFSEASSSKIFSPTEDDSSCDGTNEDND